LKAAGWREAWLRHSVLLVVSLLSQVIFIHAALQMSPEEYGGLGFMDRNRRIGELGGVAQTAMIWATNIWVWSEFIVLLTNPQRRAIHDFIAGTVVVRGKSRATGGQPGT
jgi:hypothetical protein